MTVEERATMLLKAVTADECGDADCPEHAGLHALFKLTIRAHANAALEEAAKVAEQHTSILINVEGSEPDLYAEGNHQGYKDAVEQIVAALRAMREEG